MRMIGVCGLLLLAVACSNNKGISVEDLSGSWHAIEPNGYAQFNADGTYRLATTFEGLERRPIEQGQFTIEGTLLTYISSDESDFCGAGERGIYEMEQTGEGVIRTKLQEEECSSRRFQTVTLERLP